MDKAKIAKTIAVINETCGGADISEAAYEIYLNALEGYTEAEVLGALTACARECKGRLALADIISRIDDGWPDPQEAWALCPLSEGQTVVWTNEIAQSFETVRTTGDKIAARMTFIEVYSKRVAAARAEGRRPKWFISMGHDPGTRKGPIIEAMDKGRLPEGTIERDRLPSAPNAVVKQLAGKMSLKGEG